MSRVSSFMATSSFVPESPRPPSPLAPIKIVLVEPSGPLNVGSVARVMKNMGLHQLVIVNPLCDVCGVEARQMAVHAADILETAIIVQNLPSALQGCQRAIATTSASRSLPTNLENPRDALSWLLNCPSALIFGREDRGLSNTELNYAQRFVRIPSDSAYVSLNLAQAVAICSYELYQLGTLGPNPSNLVPEVALDGVPSSLEDLEEYYKQLEALLLKIGYLYPHTAQARMAKLRRLFYRASPLDEEVAMLRGMIRQMAWALNQGPTEAEKSGSVD